MAGSLPQLWNQNSSTQVRAPTREYRHIPVVDHYHQPLRIVWGETAAYVNIDFKKGRAGFQYAIYAMYGLSSRLLRSELATPVVSGSVKFRLDPAHSARSAK